MGIWAALTLQGKLVLAGAVIGLLLLFGLISGGGDRPSSEPERAFVLSPLAISPTATRGVVSAAPTLTATALAAAATSSAPAATAAAATPTLAVAPATSVAAAAQPTATPPGPTATQPVVAAAPTEAPPPPPPPPTQPPPGCVVSAVPSPSSPPGNDSVTGTLTCGGAPSSGAAMTAVFTYELLSSGCSAASNALGTASCGVNVGRETGPLRSVDVCFTAAGQRYCTAAGPP